MTSTPGTNTITPPTPWIGPSVTGISTVHRPVYGNWPGAIHSGIAARYSDGSIHVVDCRPSGDGRGLHVRYQVFDNEELLLNRWPGTPFGINDVPVYNKYDGNFSEGWETIVKHFVRSATEMDIWGTKEVGNRTYTPGEFAEGVITEDFPFGLNSTTYVFLGNNCGNILIDALRLADMAYVKDPCFNIIEWFGSAGLNGMKLYTSREIEEYYLGAQGLAPYRYRDPLALDLDGDGLETAGLGAGIMFDHDGDGIRTGTGWIKGDDGLLVFDRNNDGIINNGRELFGDGTLRYDGSGACRDAFEALAQEDTNNDGVVNHLDDNWGRLRVWRDINQLDIGLILW